jgi:Asp-tRNA(Asn)/Glu-tRNA(Gln) amidotransferase A subunit family amidase
LDTLGLIARSVEDIALYRNVLIGVPTEAMSATPCQPPRVGVCRTQFWGETDEATKNAIESCAQVMAKGGAKVSDLKLPASFDPATRVLILEPMLATGGSISMAMAEITSRGVDPARIRLISVVAAPPALQKLSQNYPSLNIYTAIIDEGLNSRGYIVPGLGDAGDRAFGTY